jgi:2-polyprenyl-3-methyl-5-hydroxy-6-metoxy-1,4-benzoquinol methylase
MEQERYTPGDKGEIWCEHWHRYHYVTELASGKRVLDVACGEGYGAALLAGVARHVTAIDVAEDVLARARERYGGHPNLEFTAGRCEALPLEASSIDLAVSFETLEHIALPEKLLDEIARVLTPQGLLLVSTPNKEIYSDRRDYRNPHHLREFYRDEFAAMARARFPHVALLGQRFDTYSAIWPLEGEADGVQLLDAERRGGDSPKAGIADPMYLIAVCGREPRAVAEGARRFSLLSDREHFVLTDYQSLIKRLDELSAHAERIEAAYDASQRQLALVARERELLLARLESVKTAAPPAPPGPWRTP